jgi:hypothetical protein
MPPGLRFTPFRLCLLPRCILQDCNHAIDHHLNPRSRWKVDFFLGVWRPISVEMVSIADDLEIAVRFVDAPGCCAAGEGRLRLYAGIFQQDGRRPLVFGRRRDDSVFPGDCF